MKPRPVRPRRVRRRSPHGKNRITTAQAGRILGINRRTFERRYVHPACDRARARYARDFAIREDANGHLTVSRARVERWRDAQVNPRRGQLHHAPFATGPAAHRPSRTWAAALAPVVSPVDGRPTRSRTVKAKAKPPVTRTPSPQLHLPL